MQSYAIDVCISHTLSLSVCQNSLPRNPDNVIGCNPQVGYSRAYSMSMSVTYLDTIALDIYQLHKSWLQYIFQVTEGTLEPADEYLTGGIIDYCASFYFVKFMPNVSSVQYVGKAMEKPNRL